MVGTELKVNLTRTGAVDGYGEKEKKKKIFELNVVALFPAFIGDF